jgi:pyrroloquinoline-quinone synthase
MTPLTIDKILETTTAPNAFVDELQAYAIASYAVRHPLLSEIAEGRFSDLAGAIRRFLSEYYFYSRRFTQALGATLAALDDPEHRAWLNGNMAEESGVLERDHEQPLRDHGIDPEWVKAPHPLLFRRSLQAMSLTTDEILSRVPLVCTSTWVESFLAICRHGGQAQAVGALGIGTEGVVAVMYSQLLRGIKRAWPSMTARERVFFDLHALVDDDHAGILRRIAVDLARTREGRRDLAVGTNKALAVRGVFFDELQVVLHADEPRTRDERVAP